MVGVLKIISLITNNLHDFLVKFSKGAGFHFNDKQLHFFVIAIIGMFIYIVVDKSFKAMAKYSISILSFIYTFTVLIVIVFGIEIEQKITKRGNMEFADIEAGLWGFIAVFAVYIVIYNLVKLIKNNIEIRSARHIKKESQEL